MNRIIEQPEPSHVIFIDDLPSESAIRAAEAMRSIDQTPAFHHSNFYKIPLPNTTDPSAPSETPTPPSITFAPDEVLPTNRHHFRGQTLNQAAARWNAAEAKRQRKANR